VAVYQPARSVLAVGLAGGLVGQAEAGWTSLVLPVVTGLVTVAVILLRRTARIGDHKLNGPPMILQRVLRARAEITRPLRASWHR
jgi:hypothetical protein